MRLIILEEALKPIHENLDSYNLCKLVKACRKALGMKQGRVAQLSGLRVERVNKMEKGFFFVMMKDKEIRGIADLYGLPFAELKKKMIEHLEKIEKDKKIEVNCEKPDEDMYYMQERERLKK